MNGDGQLSLADVPWALVRDGIEIARREWYTKPWPEDVPALVASQPPDDIEYRLRVDECFEGSQFSYRYEGEVLNLRRPYGVHADGGPMELHVRGRPYGDLGEQTELVTHLEFSRYECRQRHIDEEMVDWQAGTAALREILQDVVTSYRS